MNIRQLQLNNYRNYSSLSFAFEPESIYCFMGKNAQGKTNLIEAIYYVSHLHSFRTNQLSSLVLNGKDWMQIRMILENNHRQEELKIIVSDQKKHLFQFQNPVRKYSDFVGIANAILFCPDDMLIFQQSPRLRRRFIDMELIKLSHSYTSTLSHFQYLLKQRNKALKADRIDSILISAFTDQMVQDQKIIISQRYQFMKELMKKAQDLYPFFSQTKEQITAEYKTFVSIDENLEHHLESAYEKTRSKDQLYRQTTLGIHKDDLLFLLNGHPLNEIGSQGQKRSYLLALKLGLAQIIYEKSGQYPILLLDDVFSELDTFRKEQLIQKLPKAMQIFITTTEPINPKWFAGRSVHFYQIENGTIREVSQ